MTLRAQKTRSGSCRKEGCMIVKLTLVSAALMLSVSSVLAAADTTTPPIAVASPTITLVVFGDSITAARQQPNDKRWPAIVERQLQETHPDRTIRVINAGVGGNTSREGLARIDTDVLAHKPDVVTVQFGGNDPTDSARLHVPLTEFAQNMSNIVARIEAVNPQTTIIMLTFPTVIDDRHSMGKMHGGLDNYIEQYRAAVRTFAKRLNLKLVDLDAAIRPRAVQYVLPDGVHLTAEGNAAIAAAVFPAVRDALDIRRGK